MYTSIISKYVKKKILFPCFHVPLFSVKACLQLVCLAGAQLGSKSQPGQLRREREISVCKALHLMCSSRSVSRPFPFSFLFNSFFLFVFSPWYLQSTNKFTYLAITKTRTSQSTSFLRHYHNCGGECVTMMMAMLGKILNFGWWRGRHSTKGRPTSDKSLVFWRPGKSVGPETVHTHTHSSIDEHTWLLCQVTCRRVSCDEKNFSERFFCEVIFPR